MAKRTTIKWYDIDKTIPGLETEVEHEICVQREAIPLVFVPGIMGTCLRRTGTDGKGKDANGLPNMRWNPSSTWWMLWNVSGTSGADRRAMLVGPQFDPDYLEPADTNPPGDGFGALMDDYCDDFLKPLKKHDWGDLGRIFEFPVYAVGYNWTDSAETAGEKLAARITKIIAEANDIVGFCEKVILITHSMGGLVSRWASEKAGAAGSILGIVHGVQPITGAPVAYWRIKAGFENFGPTSWTLGNSGERVTPVLGNIPGGLQLLPNKLHRANDGSPQWLTVTQDGQEKFSLPKNSDPDKESDPYEDIYRVPAVVKPVAGEKPSKNKYWGLVDPDLLNPGHVPPEDPDEYEQMNADAVSTDPWPVFLDTLDIAERFHEELGTKAHARTFCVRGVGYETADVVEMQVESKAYTDSYPLRGFRGFFTNPEGKSMQAVLQDPAGDGDATVVRSSAAALPPATQMPGDRAVKVEHQPAYKNKHVRAFAIEAIIALCKKRYEDRRHPLGDFPVQNANVG